jgi:hypothetical protein
MSKSLLVISYYANMPGACQAEWIDDRIFAYLDQGYEISLISSSCCFKHDNTKIDHKRVPTLSPHGAWYEYEEIKRRGITYPNGRFLMSYLKFMTFLAKVLKSLGFSSGEGRWTWFLTSTLACIFKGSRKFEYVFTTGGPASAHLTGILFARLHGKKVICELQDPLSGGEGIGRNKLSIKGLAFFEKLIIKLADCTIYCTENAMIEAKSRYSNYSNKISFVYPGSNPLRNLVNIENGNLPISKTVNITYLGSLYQTRNLDSLMQAMREIAVSDPEIINKIHVNLYGNINPDIKQRILDFEYGNISIHGLVSRKEAMIKALEADVLLLVQNVDERSIVTIPFKTYDYMHTGNLVLGLIYKNDELENMLISHGHLACQADDLEEIKRLLLKLSNDYSSCFDSIKKSKLTPALAVNEMQQLMRHHLKRQ